MNMLDTRIATIWVARALGYLVYAFVIIAEIILLLGFILLLFGANPTVGFVDWAYRNLDRVMAPFRGIFEPIDLGTASNDVEAVLDPSIIFAMVIYGIVGIGLRLFIDWLTHQMHKLERERDREEQELAAQAALASQPYTPPGGYGTGTDEWRPPPASGGSPAASTGQTAATPGEQPAPRPAPAPAPAEQPSPQAPMPPPPEPPPPPRTPPATPPPPGR